MKLAKYLANLGYGSRREATVLIQQRRVTRASGEVLREGDDAAHDDIRIDDEVLDPPPGSVIVLHKPVGYVCSTSDVPPLVYELVPSRFLQRAPVMATVGRLDRDTSGLLLLTDDGALNHRLTSPRHHVAKTYDVTLAHVLRGDETEVFGSGTLMLESESTPLAPAVVQVIDTQRVLLTLREGRYHQVRRMFAAIGNHVTALSRIAFGPLTLGELAAGEWRVLAADERERLRNVNATRSPVAGLPDAG